MKECVLKLLALLLASTILSAEALPKIPYPELEKLRQKTVVLQIALDSSSAGVLSSCNKKMNSENLSNKLAALHDQAASIWKSNLLTAQDVQQLLIKSQNCAPRASCLVYETFVNSSKATKPATKKIEPLKQIIDAQVKAMSSETYQKAWSTLRNPCGILEGLISQK